MNTDTNKQIRLVEILISELAMKWRALQSTPQEVEVLAQYHAAVTELYKLGWDGYLDFDSQLPEELMPVEYVKHHPDSGNWDHWK